MKILQPLTKILEIFYSFFEFIGRNFRIGLLKFLDFLNKRGLISNSNGFYHAFKEITQKPDEEKLKWDSLISLMRENSEIYTLSEREERYIERTIAVNRKLLMFVSPDESKAKLSRMFSIVATVKHPKLLHTINDERFQSALRKGNGKMALFQLTDLVEVIYSDQY